MCSYTYRTGKNRKRVITPEDIDSLFASKESKSSSSRVVEVGDSDNLEESDDDDDDEEEEDTRSEISRYLVPAEEVPKWLDDAAKEEKKRRAMLKKGKKDKKLFDDWRFWAAIIAGAAFVSAGWTVFQQSGAGIALPTDFDVFGGSADPNELLPSAGSSGFENPNEMVI